MPWTNFPNGISVTTATGSQAGAVVATSVSAVGLTVTTGSLIGETATFMVSMGSTSTIKSHYYPIPFNGTVISCACCVGATVTVNTGHILQIGSAGDNLTATVKTASGTLGKVTVMAVTNGSVTTADSLRFGRAVSGTAGDTYMMVTIART